MTFLLIRSFYMFTHWNWMLFDVVVGLVRAGQLARRGWAVSVKVWGFRDKSEDDWVK